MGSGKRSRGLSAGHIDKKGDVGRISRPTSRSFLTYEWISSLRQKGVIISDAEMRYRRWLALSGTSPQRSSVGIGNSTRQHSRRPQTAPAAPLPGNFRETKSSTLRKQCLPEPHAEVDHGKIVQQQREFEKQCRSFTPVTIRTESMPSDTTPHQFIVGSRYNHSNIIDTKSLSRLGVYIPRSNVGGAFINQAGILPSTTALYGRVNTTAGNHAAGDSTVPKHSSMLFDIQKCIAADRRDDSSSFGSVSLSSGLDERSIEDGNVLGNNPDQGHNDEDTDEQLMCSSEATTLTMQILEEEINNDDDITSDINPLTVAFITDSTTTTGTKDQGGMEEADSTSETKHQRTEEANSTIGMKDQVTEEVNSTTSTKDQKNEETNSTTDGMKDRRTEEIMDSSTTDMKEQAGMEDANSTNKNEITGTEHQEKHGADSTDTEQTPIVSRSSDNADGAAMETVTKTSSSIVVDMTQLTVTDSN